MNVCNTWVIITIERPNESEMCKHYSGETHHFPLIWPTLRIHSVQTHIPYNYYKSGAELGSREVKRKEIPEADSLRDGTASLATRESKPWSEVQMGEWGRSERKYLTRPGEVRERSPRRRHLSWMLKDKDEWILCLGHRPVLWVPSLDMHILRFTWLLNREISSIFNYRETYSYISIHPSGTSCNFLIQELVPLTCQAQQRGYSKLTPIQFEFLQEDVDLCCDQRGKKLTEDMQHIWKERNTQTHTHTYTHPLWNQMCSACEQSVKTQLWGLQDGVRTPSFIHLPILKSSS